MADKNDNNAEMMKVSIEVNGEFITTNVPQNSTIQALFDGGQLRGIDANAVRVNGVPATRDTKLAAEDTVQAVPSGGKLA